MDKKFCRQIDQESLVEQYVSKKLRGDLLEQFELHLRDCENHARAVLLEKALKRGVSDFARGEIKTKLHNRLKRREDTRFMTLRYAAILLVVVITPLLLYYQLNVEPEEMAKSVSDRKEKIIDVDVLDEYEDEIQTEEQLSKTELKARRPITTEVSEEKVESTAPGVSGEKIHERSSGGTPNIKPLERKNKQLAKSSEMQDMLKAVKATSQPKIEADYPLNGGAQAERDMAGTTSGLGYNQEEPSPELIATIHNKVVEDSSSIKGCINNFLSEFNRKKYTLELSIQVLNDGKIGEININKTTYPSPEIEKCLLIIVAAWVIPNDIGGGIVVQQISY